jgi:hypothetical protein
MIKVLLPLYIKYSAILAPVYGAKYCKVAGSLALAATITVYANAFFSSKIVKACATVEAFCPIATYTQTTSSVF